MNERLKNSFIRGFPVDPNDLFLGKRIVDLDRDSLISIIGYLSRESNEARDELSRRTEFLLGNP